MVQTKRFCIVWSLMNAPPSEDRFYDWKFGLSRHWIY